jgi:hypothetical protein
MAVPGERFRWINVAKSVDVLKKAHTWDCIMAIEIPVSWGELFDKITILKIKTQRFEDNKKRAHVRKELDLLTDLARRLVPERQDLADMVKQLEEVNMALWDIENSIRKCEQKKDFGERFISLARSVYITNDQRAELKHQISRLLESDLIEEKSYQEYR